MVNGAFDFDSATGDLTLQPGDAALQLGNRQGIEILAHELCEEVAGTGKRVVQVHGMQR